MKLLFNFLSIFFIFSYSLFANEPIYLDNKITELKLDTHCENFIDTQGTYSFSEIEKLKFNPPSKTHLALGFTKSVVWYKCHFAIKAETPVNWWVQVEPPALQHIDLYSPDGKLHQTGSSVAFTERPYRSTNNIFQIIQNNNQEEIYYLKIKSITTMSPSIMLYHPSEFVNVQFKATVLKGMIFGIIILIFIIVVTLFFILKDLSVASFLCSTFLGILFYLNITGWSQALYFRNWPSGYILFHGFLQGLLYTALLWSFYDIIGIKKTHPKLGKLIYGLGFIILFVSLSSFFGTFYGLPNYIVRLSSYIFSLPAFVILWKKFSRKKIDRYFFQFLAVFIYIVTVGIGIINGFGLMPIAGAATYIPQLGIMLYMVMATIGLIYKFREIDSERKQLADHKLTTNKILSEIGHEIRTPLNAILNLARLSFSQTDQIERDKKMMTIYQSTRSVLEVANTLLDFSQVNDKRITITKVNFSFTKLIEELVAVYEPLAAEKNLKFHCEIDKSTLNMFYSDPVRIKQILNNLLNNALKYTARGEILLSLKLNTNKLSIVVINTNDKIATDSGAGIGLAISHSIASLLGGDLKFQALAGIYQAEFTLPVLELQNQNEVSSNTLIGETWIIEDNQLNLEIIESAVRAAGLNYRSFVNAELALEFYDKTPTNIFLAIIDINLNEVNGVSVAEKLFLKSPQTYFIAHTGESWTSIATWIKTSKFHAVWAKPLNFEHAILELNSLKTFHTQEVKNDIQLNLLDLIHPNIAKSVSSKAITKDFLLKIYESIFESITELELLINSEIDKVKIQKLAHRLKGTAAQLSNPTLENLSAEVESFIKNEMYDEVRIRIPGLKFLAEQLYRLIIKNS